MARRRLDAEDSRSLILDAAERLMLRDGYAAVNTRTVAAEAGMKPPLVHYHFSNTDNLLLAFYTRSAEQAEARLTLAITSDNPLRSIWAYNDDPHWAALAAEFMALAVHRESIRIAMSGYGAKFRAMQETALKRAFDAGVYAKSPISSGVIVMLIAAVGRAFVMEKAIGVTAEHEATRAFIETLIATVEAGAEAPAP